MKVNLQKKKAVAAAMLLTICCCGQAWAEDITIDNDINIAAGETKTIGTDGDNVIIKSNNIYLDNGATVKIDGQKITFRGNNNIKGKGTVEINADQVRGDHGQSGEISINASVVRIKSFYMSRWDITGKLSINSDPAYKNAITQVEGTLWPVSFYNLNFNGANSYFKGQLVENANLNLGSGLTFDNGAKWIIDDFKDYSYRYGIVNNLNLLNGSVLDINTKKIDGYDRGEYFSGVTVSEIFNGDGGIIKMAFDGSVDPAKANDRLNYVGSQDKIYAVRHEGVTTIILKNLSDDTTYIKGRVLAEVREEAGSFIGGKEEGALSWTQYKLDKKTILETSGPGMGTEYTEWYIADFSHETAPTTSTKTLLSTITAGYDTWRNDTDKFNERMGELRMNGAGSDGVWVRTKGSEFGRHSSNGSYTNKQQTYQLGYDTVTSKDDKQTTYTGLAAEYGKGSLTFDSGTGTMKSMGLGVYQSQLRESGHYLDLTYRLDKYKNDFHVADSMGNPISGKYGNNAMSLSAEYGRKNALKHGWYVEPQSEVTLGYMFGNDFTTSNNIRVEQKNMPALIGRLGLNIGREVSDKVNFYMKASVNHDFLGNYDMHMTDMSTGERLNASDKFGSSWFDYGAGFSVKTGKDSYAYFDIERAVGGEYKKNWDWNAGVRWSF